MFVVLDGTYGDAGGVTVVIKDSRNKTALACRHVERVDTLNVSTQRSMIRVDSFI